MKNRIDLSACNRGPSIKPELDFLIISAIKKVRDFHKSLPNYSQTPLAVLDHLADELGVSKIFVKDESHRFELNSFKALGASYAIGSYLANRLNKRIEELPYEKIISHEIHEKIKDITFVTASDGNYGRGVAWAAKLFGVKCVVYMPKGTAQERLENVLIQGAEASITELNYDGAVQLASEMSRRNGWVLMQDTSWNGYEVIPKWIMQGYDTMALEAHEQLMELGEKPTHIFIQAGVGAMAGAVQGFFANIYGDERPITIVVEPEEANCIFRSAKEGDGKIYTVSGDMDTIMVGLACGVPSKTGWEILYEYADGFITCSDSVTAKGMRVLAAPLKNDPQVVSGESGAVGIGVLSELMSEVRFENFKKQLKLNKDSKILCFSTEGATYRKNYRDIVWNGKYPSV